MVLRVIIKNMLFVNISRMEMSRMSWRVTEIAGKLVQLCMKMYKVDTKGMGNQGLSPAEHINESNS